MVVANPPYMGSSSLGKWMGAWVKKHYPEAYRDLCTSFIDRGFALSAADGYSAMVTMQSWMFLGSFEKLRGKILRNHSISSMAHLGTRAFGAIAGEVVSTTATIFANEKSEVKGAYFRLVDMGSEAEKQAGLLEALADPDCGWFYRADASNFEVIEGCPIDYWAPGVVYKSFADNDNLSSRIDARVGLITGDRNRFLRKWNEVSLGRIAFGATNEEEISQKWIPYSKGGDYRLWYGNYEYVVNWENDGWEMKNDNYDGNRVRAHNFNGKQAFKEGITWNSISSSRFHCRYLPSGFLFDAAGPLCEVLDRNNLEYVLGLFSSSIFAFYMQLMNPTMNFPPGYLEIIPYPAPNAAKAIEVKQRVKENIEITRNDWNAFETSWGYEKHPLI